MIKSYSGFGINFILRYVRPALDSVQSMCCTTTGGSFQFSFVTLSSPGLILTEIKISTSPVHKWHTTQALLPSYQWDGL